MSASAVNMATVQVDRMLATSDADAPNVTIVTVRSNGNGIDVQADIQSLVTQFPTCTMELEVSSISNFELTNQDYQHCSGRATLKVSGLSTRSGEKINLKVTLMAEMSGATYNYTYDPLEVTL